MQDCVDGTDKAKEFIINFIEKYPENKDAKLIKKGTLEEIFNYVGGK